jgi:integrase
MNSLKTYSKKEKLAFHAVTPSFLNSYEKWMQGKGKSDTTIAIYLRPLRRLFNDAIKMGDVAMEGYPFGDSKYGKYKIPEERNFKRALSKEDIRKIFNYHPEKGSELQRARDMWVFSYLANGLNMSDIFRLKYKNIQGDTIILRRQKVKRKKSGKPIAISMTDTLQEIINTWGQKPIKNDSYIFDLLSDKMDEERKIVRIKQATKTLNKYLGKMSEDLGFSFKVTTMYARHSFATILRNAGEDVSYISEAMGHSNIKTTENYLASFDAEKRKGAAEKLTQF